MSNSIFPIIKERLHPYLSEILAGLQPGGRVVGNNYVCASLYGGKGESCKTNLQTGVGADFATDEAWGDIIDLFAQREGINQYDAAVRLAEEYNIALGNNETKREKPEDTVLIQARTIVYPIPKNALPPPLTHYKLGKIDSLWRYTNELGETLFFIARFNSKDSKTILPLTCWRGKHGKLEWRWRAMPEPRPLYGLEKLYIHSNRKILLVEGEKTADVAQRIFPDYIVLTWCGGANAVSKSDLTPLEGRDIIIWPDNDIPGFTAADELFQRINSPKSLKIIYPPDKLPEKWDLADPFPVGFDPVICIQHALSYEEFKKRLERRFPISSLVSLSAQSENCEDIFIKEWPEFSYDACPGLLGDFVRLATKNSEADPAAVCITALVRFCAEVYGYALNKGPHVFVGETVHPPRLFAVLCGNSSKARKGTSRYPVNRLFDYYRLPAGLVKSLNLSAPARESSGPLSTGEGLAYHVREQTEEEIEKWQRQNQHLITPQKGDKRLVIQDEEFASGLTCTKREGNTLSMGIRCFWDSGDYAPLTKNNPIIVKGAHINIITHITMQELAVCLDMVQAFNGFGNRFLWICVRRSKLVPLPEPMPESEFDFIQKEFWRIIAFAQKCDRLHLTPSALALWESVYPDLSQEHVGLAGNIINRAEAQTIRLSLVYALLAGKQKIDEPHLRSALAMWKYAKDSAFYIFGDRTTDPLEEKILNALKDGPLTATELSNALQRNIPKNKLQPCLQRLEAEQKIMISKHKSGGRPTLIIQLRILAM